MAERYASTHTKMGIVHPRPQGYQVFLNVMTCRASVFSLTIWIGGSGDEDRNSFVTNSRIHFHTSHFPSTQMSYESTLHFVPSTTFSAHRMKKYFPLGMQFSTHLS